MNQVETFFFDQPLAEAFSTVFTAYQWTVHHHKEETVPLNEGEEPEVIFIKEEEKKTVQIIDLLLSLKNKQTFVWVLSEENVQVHMMYMKLGADGALKIADNIEEVALFVTNLYKKMVGTTENTLLETSEADSKDIPQMNSQNFSLLIEGKEVYLTKSEYRLVEHLVAHYGETITYKELVEQLWPDQENEGPVGEERVYRIANLIFHVRQKFNQEGIKKKWIQTIRSKGYRML